MAGALSQDRPIAIAIMALGGQGGGVMMSWLVRLAEQQGWVAQSTSVPGVAQRTGATVYYVEMIAKSDRPPVLSLMPMPGMVDLVVAAEWMEAGRAIQRGFVSPDRTCLVASTHRMYSVAEKSVPGDGTMDPTVVHTAANKAAKRLLAADMAELAEKNGSVISASLFGAVAASGALPFRREAFEEAIRSEGVGVAASLKAFAAGFEATTNPASKVSEPVVKAKTYLAGGTQQQRDAHGKLASEVERTLPGVAHDMTFTGLSRVIDFQDVDYGSEYLSRLQRIHALDKQYSGADKNFAATVETAKYLAAAMAYSDVIRVADLKTRSSRFERIRQDIKAADEQIVAMTEFFHPRLEEIASLLPEKMGRKILSGGIRASIIRYFFEGGKRIRTDSLRGFLTLYGLAGLRRIRPRSLRHRIETDHIDTWIQLITDTLPQDYDLAVEIIRCRRLIKGYSDTHARGLSKYDQVMTGITKVKGRPDAAEWANRLLRLALKDADGTELAGALKTISSFDDAGAPA